MKIKGRIVGLWIVFALMSGCSTLTINKEYQSPKGATVNLTFTAPDLERRGMFEFNDKAQLAIWDISNTADEKFLGVVPVIAKNKSKTIHVSTGHTLKMRVLGILGGTGIGLCNMYFKFVPRDAVDYELDLDFPVEMTNGKAGCNLQMWGSAKGSHRRYPVRITSLYKN